MSGSARLTPREEERLVAAAQAGDNAAFDRLVLAYQSSLYRLMTRACHHPQDAEEVASEAFLKAYQSLRQFENRSSFVSWLGKIATNLCLRRRERASAQELFLEDHERGTGDEPATTDASPEERALAAEVRECVHRAVDGLREPDRTVLILRDIEQLSAGEVSRRTGLSVPAVKSRLHRARATLRERLSAGFLGPS